MRKRRPSFEPAQGDFFDAAGPQQPKLRRSEGALEGYERRVASAVARMMEMSGMSRQEIAVRLSQLLGENVSKTMLDAYASEARATHNISASRLFALTVVTEGHDVLDRLLREIGSALVVGEEIATLELGHLTAQERDLKRRRRQISHIAMPIRRGTQ